MARSFSRKQKPTTILESENIRQHIETELSELVAQNEILKSQVESLLSELDHTKRKYDQVLHEMGTRERVSDEVSRLAMKDANAIIDTAYTNADIIIREALSSARQVLIEISRISSESRELKGKLGIKLKAMENILEGLTLPEAPSLILLNEEHDTSQND